MVDKDELKYADVINTLKQLQQVKAPGGFEADLMRKIRAGVPEKKESMWDRFFIPSRFVPSAALAVLTIVILFIININSNNAEDPFSVEPKVREDVVASETMPNLQIIDDTKTDTELTGNHEETVASNDIGNADTNESGLPGSDLRATAPSEISSPAANVNYIDKSGLNFRQINISKKEREILREMLRQMEDLHNKTEGK